jgi:hypothetical protein
VFLKCDEVMNKRTPNSRCKLRTLCNMEREVVHIETKLLQYRDDIFDITVPENVGAR